MILLKVLVVLANLAESSFYPLEGAEREMKCGICTRYIQPNAFWVPEYPDFEQYPGYIDQIRKDNDIYPCGKAKMTTSTGKKKNNVTIEAENTKIIGGDVTIKNEFPWQVGLAFGYGSDITCGGTIISSMEILTAAHCVQDGRYNINTGEEFSAKGCIYAIVGEYDLSKQWDGEFWNKICDVEVHDEYLGKIYVDGKEQIVLDYDYAVLTLCRELQFKEEVAPVCLPKKKRIPAGSAGLAYDDYADKDVIASGWGETGLNKPTAEILQKVTLKTLSNSACAWNPSKSEICASKGVKGVAHGDSGGPLVYPKTSYGKEINILIGIASYVDKLYQKHFPDVFARVTYAMEWLNKKVNKYGLKGIQGSQGSHPGCKRNRPQVGEDKDSRSLKTSEGVTYYHFEKYEKLSRKKAQETCISKYGGQLTSINTKDEFEWIKEQVKDLKMFGQIAIGGQWKDKSSRKFEWTDESEMDMSVLNANWFRTRNYQFPSYKNKKRINLELWYSRRAMGFANALDHKAPTMYICKVAESCTSCSSCSE